MLIPELYNTITAGLRSLIVRNGRKVAIEGLPDGITFETLNELCLHHLGEPLNHTSHVHLSGWKSSGSYRLSLKTMRGRYLSLIFKDAIYNLEHLPALIGLPISPGPPEYLVYSNTQGALTKYLPAVYLSLEVVPGRHYQYLLEDIGEEYQQVSGEAVLSVAAELPAIHQAIHDWSLSVNQDQLLRYEAEFSAGLLEYARTNLEGYGRKTNNKVVGELLDIWPRITHVHGAQEFRDLATIRPIHGDLNTSNILIHKKYRDRIILLDWEWAGFGAAHADLASLLKLATPEIENQVLAIFTQEDKRLSAVQHKRLYQWCRLERGLLDAAFFAVQLMEPSISIPNIHRKIEAPARRVLDACRQLV